MQINWKSFPTDKMYPRFLVRNIFLIRFVVASVLLLSSIRLLIFRLSDFLPSEIPLKDSAFFVQKYDFFIENGWYESITVGASPVFNALVWIVDLLVKDPYQSMKLLSMVSMVVTILIWVYFGKSVLRISSRYTYPFVSFLIYLAFYRNAFFSGTNDGLFCVFICLGIIFLFKSILNNSQLSLFGASFFFALAFGTREIFVFYVPGITLILILLNLKSRINAKSILGLIGVFLLTTFALYFPSLIENHTFKFADKSEAAGNWAEKNYLQVYLGENQISFQDVETFKNTNPDVTLPQTYSEAIFFNPKLTVSNFLRQLILIQKPFVWQIGVLFLFLIGMTIWNIKKGGFLSLNVLAILLFITFTFSFSILLINRVEFRWFMVFPFLFSALTISFIERNWQKYPLLEYMFLANCLLISVLNFNLIGVWK
ncbi:MAG: hypothetical protein ACI8ZM_005518 [Crocinitomix sp.]|jgi:hypothetical protein